MAVKNVQVPGIGLVEFPGDMSDSDISGVLKKQAPKVETNPQAGIPKDVLESAFKSASLAPSGSFEAGNKLLGEEVKARGGSVVQDAGDVIRGKVGKMVQDASMSRENLETLGVPKSIAKVAAPVERAVAGAAGGVLDPDNAIYLAGGGLGKPVADVLGKSFAGLMLGGAASQGTKAVKEAVKGNYERAIEEGTGALIQGGLGALGAKAGTAEEIKPTTETEVPNASSQQETATVHGNVRPLEKPAEVVPIAEGERGVQPQIQGGIPETKTGEVSLKVHPEIERYKSLPQADMNAEIKSGGKGLTGLAYDLGEKVSAEDIPALEAARSEWVKGNKESVANAKNQEEKLKAFGAAKPTQFFEEAKRFRQAIDEAVESGAKTKEEFAAIEHKHGVGYLDKGKAVMEAVEREKVKEPEMIGMGAAVPGEFSDHPIDWIENDPNIVRKTGLQSFIEKVSKNPSQSWNDAIQKGIPVARALKEYFKGQEKGGVEGRKAATEELKVADKFLEADANNIRSSLTKLVNESLPVAERGRFVSAISNATKRPPILTGDVEGMYKNAAQVAARIEDRAHEYAKETTTADIKKTVEKAIKSPSVDVEYKKRIQDAVKRLGFSKLSSATESRLKGTREFINQTGVQSVPDAVVAELDLLNKVPAKELPLDALEAIRDRVQLLDKLGRLKVQTRQALWEAEKGDLRDKMADSESVKLEEHPELRPQPGEKATLSLKLRNFINRRLNTAASVDRGISPRDVLFDLMDGAKAKYRGFMSRVFGGRIDSGFNRMLVRRNEALAPIEKFGKEQKFNDQNYERIGTYGALQQEGGRERLIENGADPAVLDRIASSLTPSELKMYDLMRGTMDKMLPEVKSLMRNLYNIDVKPVENYFPMLWDWRQFEQEAKAKPIKGQEGGDVAFDELAAWKTLEQDYVPRRTTKTERGFTIERAPGAATPIKIHALDIVSRHLQDVSHLLEQQRDIKMLGEVARHEDFLEKYGSAGQKFALDWLDTVAKQGGTEAFRRIPILDILRRNTTLGVIGFRLASQFVHLANVPIAMKQAGPGWYLRGVRDATTKEGQEFIKKNFAETFARAGAEPAIEESAFRKLAGPAFYIVKGIDRLNSQSTVLGTYQRLLAEKGIDPQLYDKIPVDEAARNEALIRARRAVASPLPKDVPQALSRGAVTGGNVSVGRSLFQFQNVFLDQWSILRHDLMRAGIQAGNAKEAVATTAALAAMVLIETGIKYGTSQAIQSATGYKPKKPESFQQKAVIEALRRFPFMGNLISMAMYGESGVPAIDAVTQVVKAGKTALTAKTQKARDKAAIQAISGAAQAAGVPGASQVGEVIEKSQ